MNTSKASVTSGKILRILLDKSTKNQASFSTSHCQQISKDFILFCQDPSGESKAKKEKEFEVNSKVLRKLEKLSMLTFEDDDEYIKFFKNNIAFVNKLSEVDTTNVPPMYTVQEDTELCLREDIAEPQMVEGVLQNASEQFEGYFVVPTGSISLHSELDISETGIKKDFWSV